MRLIHTLISNTEVIGWLKLLFILPALFTFYSFTWEEKEEESKGYYYYDLAKEARGKRDIDSMQIYLSQAKQVFEQENIWLEVYNCYRGIWFAKRLLRDSEAAFAYADSMLYVAKHKIEAKEERHAYLASAYGSLALLYNESGFYEQSITNYEASIKELEQVEDNDPKSIATNWNNLAKVYSDKGDYEKAQSCYRQSLKLLPETEYLIRPTVLNNLGYIYYKLEDYQLAKSLFLPAFRLFKENEHQDFRRRENFFESYINTCNNLGTTYLALNQLDSTAYFLSRALDLQEKEEIDRSQSITYTYLGRLNLENGNTTKGIQFLKKGLDKALEQYELPNTYVARCYFQLAAAYEQQQEVQTAIDFYAKSIGALVRDSLINGLPTDIEEVVSEIELLKSLSARAALLRHSDKSGKDVGQLQEALSHYQVINQLITKIRQSYVEEQSKHYLAERSHEIYGEAIQVALALYHTNQDAQYLEMAFHFIESNKASALFESLKENEARMFSKLGNGEESRKLLVQEEKLKREIANYKRLIYEAENKGFKSKLSQWNTALFERKAQFQELRKELEAQFPDYYQLKYNTETASLETIQTELLAQNEAMLTYYLGGNFLITMLISKEAVSIHQSPFDANSLFALQTYLKEVSSFDFYEEPEEQFNNYVNSAFTTYSVLIGDLPINKELFDRLIIIPDGIINYISFPGLLMKKPIDLTEISYSPSHLDYMLNHYAFTYGYSASQLYFHQQEKKRKAASKLFAGFAPTFVGGAAMTQSRSCDSLGLSPLTENQIEVKQIANLLGGETFLGQKASREQFGNIASDYRILHLATHACSQADAPLHQKIFFGESDYLYAFDLYDLDISADLVVLSACETGFGELVEGEGVLSIARGFAYAGSPSILTSLWSVSDKATAEIMVSYYQFLKKGFTKSSALQKAQLSYLDQQKSHITHPVYWASFIQVGQDIPIFSSWNKFLFIGLLGFLLVVVAIYFRKNN